MKEFIKGVLSEQGLPSSKRAMLFILLLTFVFIILYNLFSGHKPDQTLQDQLYYMLTTNIALIFGSNIANVVKDIKTGQSASTTTSSAS